MYTFLQLTLCLIRYIYATYRVKKIKKDLKCFAAYAVCCHTSLNHKVRNHQNSFAFEEDYRRLKAAEESNCCCNSWIFKNNSTFCLFTICRLSVRRGLLCPYMFPVVPYVLASTRRSDKQATANSICVLAMGIIAVVRTQMLVLLN